MPYKKRTKKRTYRRKRRTQALNKQVVRTSPLPASFKTTLRYCDRLTLDPTTGVAADVFSANGLFDPYIAAGGHQPRGWDQLIPMYGHATVIGAKILCQFQNTDGANSSICGISLRGGSAVETGIIDYIEQSNVSYKMVGDHNGGGRGNVTMNFNNKFLGVSKPMSMASLRNDSTANPDEQAYFHIFAGNTNNVDILPVIVQVTIEYIVVFTEPKDLIVS